MSQFFSIDPNVPLPQKPQVVTGTELDALWQAIQTQFPNGIIGLSPGQILQKVGAVIPLAGRAALVGAIIKDWVQIIADITVAAKNISDLYQQNDACICEQLTCLVKAVNESALPRQAKWDLAKGQQFLLQRLGDNIRLAAVTNRQGFCLDDFAAGCNELSETSQSRPYGTLEDFSDSIAEDCQTLPVPFTDPE